jgi:dTDP-4-amino-4,6-dideoxygalactose transaminase
MEMAEVLNAANAAGIPGTTEVPRAPARRAPVFVPSWPVLSPAMFWQVPNRRGMPYPLSAPSVSSFYVARNAIFHLFRALRLRADEAVLVPDYHSGNEVSAIRAAGAQIRFYSVRRDLQPDFDQLEKVAGRRARVLYVIHFMGWPQPVSELADFCRRRNLVLIEDCALSLLSDSGGRPLGTYGDYAVFCLYKTLPVPNGGLLVQNRNILEELRSVPVRACGNLSTAGRTGELLLAWLRSRAERVGRPLARIKAAVGRQMTSLRVKRIPVGDIGFDLLNVYLGMSRISRLLLERFDYQDIRQTRRDNFFLLQKLLEGRTTPLCTSLPEGVCPLFFPILVRHKHEAAAALLERGIEATELWNTGDPYVPVEGSEDARFLRDHVLELPIHQGVSPAQIEYMAHEVAALGLRL